MFLVVPEEQEDPEHWAVLVELEELVRLEVLVMREVQLETMSQVLSTVCMLLLMQHPHRVLSVLVGLAEMEELVRLVVLVDLSTQVTVLVLQVMPEVWLD